MHRTKVESLPNNSALVTIGHQEERPCGVCGSIRFLTTTIVDGWLDYTATTVCAFCGDVLRVAGTRPVHDDDPIPLTLTMAGIQATA